MFSDFPQGISIFSEGSYINLLAIQSQKKGVACILLVTQELLQISPPPNYFCQHRFRCFIFQNQPWKITKSYHYSNSLTVTISLEHSISFCRLLEIQEEICTSDVTSSIYDYYLLEMASAVLSRTLFFVILSRIFRLLNYYSILPVLPKFKCLKMSIYNIFSMLLSCMHSIQLLLVNILYFCICFSGR